MRWGRKSTGRTPGLASGSGSEHAQLLLHLRDMPVPADAVRTDALVDLAEGQVRLGVAAGTRDATLGVHHEVRDEPGPCERRERQDGRGGVAAGSADDGDVRGTERGELRPMQLRQPVDRTRQQFRRRMLEAIPAGIVGGSQEPEVGSLVDDRSPGREDVARLCRRQTVGQRQEHGVSLWQHRVDGVAGSGQVGMHAAYRLLLATATLEPHDTHVRVLVEQPHHLAAGISGRADDADPDARTTTKRRRGSGDIDGWGHRLGHRRRMIPAAGIR